MVDTGNLYSKRRHSVSIRVITRDHSINIVRDMGVRWVRYTLKHVAAKPTIYPRCVYFKHQFSGHIDSLLILE